MTQTLSGTLSDTGGTPQIFITDGGSLDYAITGTFDATVDLQRAVAGKQAWETIASLTAAGSGRVEKSPPGLYRFNVPVYDSGDINYALSTVPRVLQSWQGADGREVFQITDEGVVLNKTSVAPAASFADTLGAIASVTGLSLTVKQFGGFYQLDFTLSGVAVPFTDAAGSGSFGALKLFDFVEGAFQSLGSRQNLHFTGDDLIDGDQGDLVFIHALGSVTANAGDKALTSTEADIAAVSGDVTLSTYEADSSVLKGAGTPVDGMTTAKDIWLNLSGSAATAEANGVMTVDGSITVLIAALGDA